MSRGLGYVYKRQRPYTPAPPPGRPSPRAPTRLRPCLRSCPPRPRLCLCPRPRPPTAPRAAYPRALSTQDRFAVLRALWNGCFRDLPRTTVESLPLATYIDGVDGLAAHAGAINIGPFRCTPGSGAVGSVGARTVGEGLGGLPPVAFRPRLGLCPGTRGVRAAEG